MKSIILENTTTS